MSVHPGNLVLRFVLEIFSLVAMAVWGFHMDPLPIRYFFMMGTPLVAAIIWWAFNVPADPFRSGDAPVQIRGGLRLLLETGIFLFSVFCTFHGLGVVPAIVFLVLLLVHYFFSWDRIRWLLRK